LYEQIALQFVWHNFRTAIASIGLRVLRVFVVKIIFGGT